MTRATNWIGRSTIIFLWTPIAYVILSSLTPGTLMLSWDALSLDAYRALFSDHALLRALRVSSLVATGAATIATATATLAAIALSRERLMGRIWWMAILTAPLVIPEIVAGAALLSVFAYLGSTFGYGTLIAGHLTITLPIAILIIYSGMRALDSSVVQAAYDMGATPVTAFWRVMVPILRPSLAAAWLVAFTTSLGNIVISTFTSGVGTTTMPLRIYSLAKTGLPPTINALGTILIVITLIAVISVRASRITDSPASGNK